MQYIAKKPVNLGGGHFLAEGQTTQLPAGVKLPGLEPVLEKVPGGQTLETTGCCRNIDCPGRGKVLAG